MKRSFIREILESIDKDTISFAGGLPDENLFPIKELKEANIKLYNNPKNLQYSTSSGITSLKEKIANFYNSEGFETSADNILITTGSQQALYIISNYFEHKQIIIEEPSYLGAVNTFRANNLDIKSVKLHNTGIDIEKFNKLYKSVKLAYLIPDYQNPTSAYYDKEIREKVAKTVLENNGYLIEDAPYSQLYFKDKLNSISSILPNNSFHLGSFSKTLSPSLRIGWVRANKDIISKLTQIKETIDLHSCTISQYIIDNYLDNVNQYREHLQNLRKKYFKKLQFFEKSLNIHLPSFKYKSPKGGMFIYGELNGIDTYKLVKKCMEEKVVYVPGNQFYLNENMGTNEIRFNFTHTSETKVDKGLKIIAKIL